MSTTRTRTNGVSRQTAQNMLDIARLKNVRISALEKAIDMKSSGLSRIARDTAGHRLYAQDIVMAAKFLHVSVDDIVNWHQSGYSRDRFKIRNFLLKAADDTSKNTLNWEKSHDGDAGTIYKAGIGEDALLCVNAKGAAWIEDGGTAHPIADAGDPAALTLISAITQPPKVTKHALKIIDRFMSEERADQNA